MKNFFKFLLRFIIASIVVSILTTILSTDNEVPSPTNNDAYSITLPTPATTTPLYPTFYDLLSLRDYMNEEKALGNDKVTFLYKGSEDLVKDSSLAKMTASISVHYSNLEDRYTVTMHKYPGERIVEAYRSGDTSQLSAEELLVLEKVTEIVDFGTEQATDSLELEQFLHDVICEEVTYYTDERVNNFEYPDVPRYLSVVGALLDGQANCQGYTDTFYTLASIAGFQVSKMSVVAPDGGHQVNTIYLNDNWYVVDVTYDDRDTDSYGTDYGRFNIGLDLVKDYTWAEIYERVPIATTTDPQLYFYYSNDLAFETVQDFSQMIAQTWSETDQTTYYGMVKNEPNGDTLTDALSAALNETEKGYSYRYIYSCNSQDCFYTVVFE